MIRRLAAARQTASPALSIPTSPTRGGEGRLSTRAKFAPIGKRSVVGGYPHFDYLAVPLTESVPQLNDACLLVCHDRGPWKD